MNYETSITDVAGTEGIDTSVKLQLVQDEIAQQLLGFLLRRDGGWAIGSGTQRRRQLGVSDVVVTDELRRWHTLRALAMIFRDAFDNQLNDRYEGKWQNYERLQAEAERLYLTNGVGLVWTPAPRPGAPEITTTRGPSIAGTYCFAYSWVTQDGSEGQCGDAASITLDAQTQAVVSCGTAPSGISGWNLYAGASLDGLALQNTAPLAPVDHWAQGPPLRSGPPPGAGQPASRWLVDDHRLRRG